MTITPNPGRARVRFRTLAAAVALAIGSIGVGAAVASAHTAQITVKAVCTDSGWDATYTVTNDQNYGKATLSGTNTALDGPYAAGAVASATVHLSFTDNNSSVSGTMTWHQDKFAQNIGASIRKPADCVKSKPHTTANVTFVEGSVACQGTNAVYTKPSYTTSGDNVIFDAPVADFGASITVHASAKDGYILDGNSSFAHTYGDKPTAPDCRTTATVVSPTIHNAVCTGPGTSGTPSFDLPDNNLPVKYTADGNVVTAHIAVVSQGDVKFAANLPDGWTRVSDTVATFTVTYTSPGRCLVKDTPINPLVTQAVCTGPGTNDGGSITANYNTDGIVYSVEGQVVTAHLRDGYRFPGVLPDGWVLQEDGTATFTVVFNTAPDCLVQSTPVAPKVTEPVCKDGTPTKGSITPVETTGVVYKVDGDTVTASPAEGYYFAEGTQTVFKVALNSVVCPKTVMISSPPKSPLPAPSVTPAALPFTGANVVPMLGLAGSAIVAGLVLMLAARRRRNEV